MISRRHLAWAALVWAILPGAPSPEGLAGAAADAQSAPPGSDRSAPRAERPWPVDVPIHLSSSFGEFRGGHLHAGVDIRSFGREGIPCRAVGSGYVARLRTSPWGYGKAVYVKLETGETAVYAHLAEFAPEIESVVLAAQLERQRYAVDIYPAPGDLPVKEGQIIAYTGRTGAAAPHLHFEVRDAAERPVNPLEIGWSLRDDSPPTIRRLQCLPLSPDARVNGRFAPAVVELRSSSERTFAARDTLRVSGAIGFGAQIVDRAGESSGNLAPFRVELEVDGRRLAVVEMRRFSYEQTAEVELVYDMAKARTRDRHYMLLFRRGGETLGGREFVNDGIFRAAGPGEAGGAGRVHDVVVRAADCAGNVSTASWAFVVVAPGAAAPAGAPPARAARAAPDAGGELPGLYFFEDMMGVRPHAAEGSGGLGSGGPGQGAAGNEPGAGTELVVPFEDVGDRGRSFPVRVGGVTREVHVVAAEREGGVSRDFADLGAGLSVGGGSLYGNALLYLAAWERSCAGALPEGAGLRAATEGVRFGPVSAVFKGPVEIRFFAGGAGGGKAAVFRFDERKGSWSMRPSSARGDSVSAPVREPGVYAVLIDSLAPSIGAPNLAARRSFATGSTVYEAVIPITDKGSGVDADRTEVYLNGKKQIARWDGFSEKVFVILRDENIIGVHDLAIVAADRLGNSTRLVTQLHVPAPGTKGGTGGSR